MTTIKIHQNSVLSTPGAFYTTADAGNMYLASKLKHVQYMQFKITQTPKSIQDKYKLAPLVDPSDYVYVRIKGALYGLKESGRIANEDITDHLARHGYQESKVTPGLFKHYTRPISFTLVVDDFGIKWINKQDLDHLLDCLQLKYDMKIDMESKPVSYTHLTLPTILLV